MTGEHGAEADAVNQNRLARLGRSADSAGAVVGTTNVLSVCSAATYCLPPIRNEDVVQQAPAPAQLSVSVYGALVPLRICQDSRWRVLFPRLPALAR